ncbi:hypothetical protein MYCTH_2112630 [Thermothelomyces thermophilus ATCC 42464]|uniref:Uncharacterized protein n=1 Tax=Thermothelomyces thermophilus (strain ATCC 42464 / BCRC 31852 / DSM 1799) TaxID=573729 RepID=G2QKU0_THET4|nr:uncharacterized protein MYCTH_2112630 [Thermothelomyces thermophilus ATCC 42464]AEO60572.1 hypothetical protein MYCTH_2112630 [Thermothelomyces thermophilus ATCC 42464]
MRRRARSVPILPIANQQSALNSELAASGHFQDEGGGSFMIIIRATESGSARSSWTQPQRGTTPGPHAVDRCIALAVISRTPPLRAAAGGGEITACTPVRVYVLFQMITLDPFFWFNTALSSSSTQNASDKRQTKVYPRHGCSSVSDGSMCWCSYIQDNTRTHA